MVMSVEKKTDNKLKKRLILSAAFVLVLVFTSMSFAHAYTTSSGTIGIADPAGDLDTGNATASQPDWNSVLATQTETFNFYPDSVGDETAIAVQYPTAGEHWDKVDETSSDGDTSYIQSADSSWQGDLYSITNHSTQEVGGTVNYVRVYMVCKAMTDNITQSSAYVRIKTNGSTHNGAEQTVTSGYAAYLYQWNTNLSTGQPWTWNEIDNLQIGVVLRTPNVDEYTRCTQVFAVVSLTAPLLTGSVPTGDLFDIATYSDYSDDLAVKVYLTNTDNLTSAYQSLSIELYLEDSVEAGQTPDYQVLTIQNGMATFQLIGGSGGSHTLSVTGGDYTLTSRNVSDWDTEWSVAPEIYCEVLQR